jgi:hypothetical protein
VRAPHVGHMFLCEHAWSCVAEPARGLWLVGMHQGRGRGGVPGSGVAVCDTLVIFDVELTAFGTLDTLAVCLNMVCASRHPWGVAQSAVISEATECKSRKVCGGPHAGATQLILSQVRVYCHVNQISCHTNKHIFARTLKLEGRKHSQILNESLACRTHARTNHWRVVKPQPPFSLPTYLASSAVRSGELCSSNMICTANTLPSGFQWHARSHCNHSDDCGHFVHCTACE